MLPYNLARRIRTTSRLQLKTQSTWALLATTALWISASGMNCLPTDPGPRAAGLKAFNSQEELRKFLVDQAKSRNSANRSNDGWGLFLPFAPSPSAAFSEADDTAGSGGGDSASYSTTNVQEAGVDESDLIKNDGENIYWLSGSTIRIVRAATAGPLAELATVELDDSGQSLYLRGDQLIAVSNRYSYGWGWGDVWVLGSPEAISSRENSSKEQAEPSSDDGGSSGAVDGSPPGAGGSDDSDVPDDDSDDSDIIGGPWNDGGQVTVTFIDVSDPASPAITAEVEFEGQLASSRMIDDRLYLVLISQPLLPENPTTTALETMTLDEWLPDYAVKADGQEIATGDIAGWQSFYRPDYADGYNITTVATLDVDTPTAEPQSTAIVADAGEIYASTEALYITDVEYDWTNFSSRSDTIVHKLAFTEAGTEYVASGTVPGRPLNQYSLGEYDDYLRIATTQEEFAGPPLFETLTSNAVYVLGVTDDSLDVVGSIEDIAPGETIYAARFIGDRGFLVTFQRVDPLFTLDLSDPFNPAIVGELKVPGYSDHIQLLDENHLLTIGKDAVEDGPWAWVQGVQLSIFDVSDPADPTLKHKEIIGGRGTSSEANYNPKAFNFFAERGLLAFPIDVYGDATQPFDYGNHEFSGVMVYAVDADTGFDKLGEISTMEQPQFAKNCWWGYWGSARGVFIGDDVYAVSDLGVKRAAVDDVNTVLDSVSFQEPPQDNCWWDDPIILPMEDGGLR